MRIATRAVLAILIGYRRFVSPLLPGAFRYIPSCSDYAQQAIERYGIVRGAGMAFRRLASCHPFHEGGFDPLR